MLPLFEESETTFESDNISELKPTNEDNNIDQIINDQDIPKDTLSLDFDSNIKSERRSGTQNIHNTSRLDLGCRGKQISHIDTFTNV